MKKRVLVLAAYMLAIFTVLSGKSSIEVTSVEVVPDSEEQIKISDEAVPLYTIKENTITFDSNLSGVYKYCPTSIEGNVLYCSNAETPGEVKDGIYLEGKKVLGTTKGAWDSAQVCDPSVVAGDFSYKNESYKYLMAYLGCATYDCTANEVGFAVSNDLKNWKKTGRVISAVRDGCWGVGQPSLLNYNGTIYLFYTSGTSAETTTYVESLDCSDLESVQHLGKTKITCSYDFISNADFAYSNGYLYMTCDTHPFPSGALDFISSVQSVYNAPWDGSIDSLGRMNWEKIGSIGQSTTGHERNHNGCFFRDKYGGLESEMLYVTTADSVGSWSENLYTYRFVAVTF